ncbi:hypothetical protein MRX96_059249 [Rhipicephalus microplus]
MLPTGVSLRAPSLGLLGTLFRSTTQSHASCDLHSETMDTLSCSDDNMVQCPYDPHHNVKQARIGIHVSKCKRAVGRPCLRPCLFNAEHLVPHDEPVS